MQQPAPAEGAQVAPPQQPDDEVDLFGGTNWLELMQQDPSPMICADGDAKSLQSSVPPFAPAAVYTLCSFKR